jgi:hypothetical protein
MRSAWQAGLWRSAKGLPSAGESACRIGTVGGQVRETRDLATHGLSDRTSEWVTAFAVAAKPSEAKPTGFESLD